MAINAQQLKKLITPKLATKNRKDLTWAKLVAAVQDASQGEKNQLVTHCSNANTQRAGAVLIGIVQSKINEEAEAEADAMLTDNALSFAELERIFFDGQGNGDQ